MASETLVTGEITPADGSHFEDATVYVRLENVSMMDAPAAVLSEQILHNVDFSGKSIPFELVGAPPDNPNGRYNVRVHISMTGSNEFSKGDYITKRSYPVESGKARNLQVKVERI